MESLIGKTLGTYEIVSEIGRGGMAIVYKAYQRSLERFVALKVLPPQFTFDFEFLRRFQVEAKAAAKLKHPNIVTIYDVGEQNGWHYIVMEFLDGVSLAHVIRREGALAPTRVAHIVAQIASALDYAHALGFVHRDIKPGNIIIGVNDHATLTDFGIVKAAEGTRVTKSGMMIGTPEYIAPEQIRGQAVDARADVYALGVVCYEMLTGRVPFQGDTARVLYAQVHEMPSLLHIVNPRVSLAVEQAVNTALAKDPAQRFGRAGEFASALTSAVSGVVVIPSPAPEPPTRYVSRPRPRQATLTPLWLVGMVGIVLIVCVLVFALAMPQQKGTPTLLPSRFTDARGVPMVLVPEGEFTMGSDPDVAFAECKKLHISSDCKREWFEDEYPPHTVSLSAFYIDQFEVTNARYTECVKAGKCTPPNNTSSYRRSSYYDNPQFDNYPVIYVNWEQAKAYCEWREARLPTEAEWEKAARGIDGRLYPWGNTFDGRHLNFCDRNCPSNWANKEYDDGHSDTAPVGSYANGTSPYGALDMAGNVWEWVADWYDAKYYATSPRNNPTGPSSGQYRVVRGGAWISTGRDVRVGDRGKFSPTDTYYHLGFRCARFP